MNVKKNRAVSFLLVGLVYAAAAAVGVLCYVFLPWAFWLNLLVADVAATVFVFVFSLIFKNASVYDPYWSVQPIVILAAFVIGAGVNLAGALIFAFVCLWGVRLTANWAYTFKNLEAQDWRYTMLSQKTGKAYPIVNFLGIHMFPTLVVYACTLPAVFVIKTGAAFNAWSLLCLAVCLLATLLQLVSDIQMQKFRAKKTGGFIRDGLWKHSRHPNYLGEILMWWGVGGASVVCLGGSYFWLFAGALVNTLMFLFISIPMADKRQARKAGFAEYKKQTRMLLPIPVFGLKK